MASRGVTSFAYVAVGVLSLSLALARPVEAQSLAGTLATGTVAVRTPRGLETGAIRVEAAGGVCKVEIALDSPGRRRAYTLVMQGRKTVITAPAGVAEMAPLPVDPQIGCALLPRAAGVSSWSGANLAWGADPDGTPTLSESVAGSERLRIRFTSVTGQSFPASDFSLPGGAK